MPGKKPNKPLREERMAQEKKKPVAETHNPPVNYSVELGSLLALQTETPKLYPCQQQASRDQLCYSCLCCLS